MGLVPSPLILLQGVFCLVAVGGCQFWYGLSLGLGRVAPSFFYAVGLLCVMDWGLFLVSS